jgi:hypothetical protein
METLHARIQLRALEDPADKAKLALLQMQREASRVRREVAAEALIKAHRLLHAPVAALWAKLAEAKAAHEALQALLAEIQSALAAGHEAFGHEALFLPFVVYPGATQPAYVSRRKWLQKNGRLD